mmetsp:Transcript_5985/g.13783  ORF Transcript_5985/g.13783 Transcript_5985/m.13783 type:complete len:190 (+) Transcript_5985:85-654(+)
MAHEEPPPLNDGEEVQHVQGGVQVFVDDKPAIGRGTLYVTTQNVRWKPEAAGGSVLALQWRSVLMHAVSRDPNTFPHPCIYCQIHGCQEQLGGGAMADEEVVGAMDEDEQVTEVRFAVDDEQGLSVLFQVFSECQALHPDDVEQDEGEFMFNVDEVEEGALSAAMGQSGIIGAPGWSAEDRFADADEDN